MNEALISPGKFPAVPFPVFTDPFRERPRIPAPAFRRPENVSADFRNAKPPELESILDEEEGPDILMVKPALCYLDVIAKIAEKTLLPVAAYNVSGEYSMIHAAAEKGYGDLYAMAAESLFATHRPELKSYCRIGRINTAPYVRRWIENPDRNVVVFRE